MEDYMKCICCHEEQVVLISVEMKSTSIFSHRRGVCQKCLKDKDINNVCVDFEIREAGNTIKEAKVRITEMEEHIKRLNDAKLGADE